MLREGSFLLVGPRRCLVVEDHVSVHDKKKNYGKVNAKWCVAKWIYNQRVLPSRTTETHKLS